MRSTKHFEHQNTNLYAFAPGLFVVLWATGFIGAKAGIPYAEPFTFLTWRFYIVAVVLGFIAVITNAPFPKRRIDYVHIAVAGLLVQGIYLGGVFAAISLGVSASVSAIIVGVQPLLTALIAGPILGEQLRPRQWLGFIVGLLGLILVVTREFRWQANDLSGLVLCVASLIAIAAGTIYQKKYCANLDLRSGSMIQFLAAGTMMLVVAFLFEQREVMWTAQFVFALAWLCLVLSVGAISLFFILIRRGEASRVAALFYLVPPVTTLMAWVFFGETLRPLAIFGMVLSAVGVAMVVRN
jgi:drug/metabolite transporter (DMT)-like permease